MLKGWFARLGPLGSRLGPVAAFFTGALLFAVARWVAEGLTPWAGACLMGLGGVAVRGRFRGLEQGRLYDSLTGLCSRFHFFDQLDRELARARRDDRPLALMVFDLDRFKSYNDAFGHPRGDRLLQRVGQALAHAMRAGDVVGRWGGEEFAAVLPGAGLAVACMVAERARLAVHEACSEATSRGFWPITMSVGIALFPEDGRSNEDLLQAADQALYAAKVYRDCSEVYANVRLPLERRLEELVGKGGDGHAGGP